MSLDNYEGVYIMFSGGNDKYSGKNILKLLKRFLKEKNMVFKYSEISENLLKLRTSCVNPFNCITWLDTAEGYGFWYGIELQWVSELLNYIGDDNIVLNNGINILTHLMEITEWYDCGLLTNEMQMLRLELQEKLNKQLIDISQKRSEKAD